MRIGFFGGSFDPIHLGHTQMAKQLMDVWKLDEVWFSPAKISPFKMGTKPVPVEKRITMVELAISDEPRFRLYDNEAKKKGPSYTVETVREFSRIPNKEFYLIISDEAAAGFFSWKEAVEIVRMISVIVGTRLGTKAPEEGNSEICEALKMGWTPTQPLNISSTQIRQDLREGKDCSAFLYRNVLDFIYQNRLYFSV